MEMPRVHTVRQGEHLAGIATKYGFKDWKHIYDHPSNANLKGHRADPFVLNPGDDISIPNPRPKCIDCATDKLHVFRLVGQTVAIRIAIHDSDGGPLKAAPYSLIQKDNADGPTIRGHTDDAGVLECAIPVSAQLLELSIGAVTWDLHVGHLDPVEDAGKPLITGVQGRLKNLGLYAGAIDGVLGPKTRAAVRQFQRTAMSRTDPDGEIDLDTASGLQKDHGC
jgi:Putative peptidoglycan binding domain